MRWQTASRAAGLVLALALVMCSEQTDQGGYEMASAGETPVLCADAVTADRVRAIMVEALDDALKNHIIKVFTVWMQDDTKQPERAAFGVRQGVSAYIAAQKRAALWAPMDCPG